MTMKQTARINSCQDAFNDTELRSSLSVNFATLGWCAAERGEPRDENRGGAWLTGFDEWVKAHPGHFPDEQAALQ